MDGLSSRTLMPVTGLWDATGRAVWSKEAWSCPQADGGALHALI